MIKSPYILHVALALYKNTFNRFFQSKYIKLYFYSIKYLVSTMHFYTVNWFSHLFAVVSRLKYIERDDGNSGDSGVGMQVPSVAQCICTWIETVFSVQIQI